MVQNMQQTFVTADTFNSDLSSWDVRQVPQTWNKLFSMQSNIDASGPGARAA